MMENKNILYIGPYIENSVRGRAALNNIKYLEKMGHSLTIKPIYIEPNNSYDFSLYEDKSLEKLESNYLDKYDICIQHCDILGYVNNRAFDKNIGIFDFINYPSQSIINSRLNILDKIIVNSLDKKLSLQDVLNEKIYSKVFYCPQYADLDEWRDIQLSPLSWKDKNIYYFYSELEFTDMYDWKKLVYVYITNFAYKNAQLILKTSLIKTDEDVAFVNKTIHDIAINANVSPEKTNLPKIIAAEYSDQGMWNLYNAMDCFIDVSRGSNFNYTNLKAAFLNKDIIVNKRTSSSTMFDNLSLVEGLPIQVDEQYYDDTINFTMYDYAATMDTNSLKEIMNKSYLNRNPDKNRYEQQLQGYDFTNINKLL